MFKRVQFMLGKHAANFYVFLLIIRIENLEMLLNHGAEVWKHQNKEMEAYLSR